MNTDEMRDWPEDLRVNAVSVVLAHAIHDARRDAYCPAWPTFQELPVSARRSYLEMASAFLKAAKPKLGFGADLAQILPTLARQQMKAVAGGR